MIYCYEKRMPTGYNLMNVQVTDQCMRFRYLAHRRVAKARASLEQNSQSLGCLHTQRLDVDEVCR